ncbi:MAG: S9 family peptidase, partial [Bacteroidota bacterium]
MNIRTTLLGILGVLLCTPVFAQTKQPLTVADYHRWSGVYNTEVSDDGMWFAYSLRPNGGDDTLFVQHLNDEGTVYEIPNASNPVFSEDNNWVAYRISPDEESAKKLRKSKKPVHRKAELLNLKSGEKVQVERMQAMAFDQRSAYWVVHRNKPGNDKSKHKGSDLLVRNLNTGSVLNIGNVTEFSFNKKASHLAYVVDADNKSGNGVYVMHTEQGSIQPVETDSAHYHMLAWDDVVEDDETRWEEKGNVLAFMKGEKVDSLIHMQNEIVVFEQKKGAWVSETIESTSIGNFPEGMVISEKRPIRWSADGSHVMFGLDEQEEKVELSKDTVANLDVWHWNDDRIQSVQMRQARNDKRFTHMAVYHLDKNTFVQIADESVKNVWASDHNRYTVGRDRTPYINDVNWGVDPSDLYRIDLTNNERVRFAENIKRWLGFSPDGRYFLYQKVEGDGADLLVYDLEKNKQTNVSEVAPVAFINNEHIYPHENPTFGLAGWTKDGKHVIVNQKYDLWMLALDGSDAVNITQGMGEEQEIIFRYLNLDGEDYIDTKKTMMVSAFGKWTKKDGFFRVDLGKKPKELVFDDVSYGRPIKAEDAGRLVMTRQTFEDFPDYYSTNTSFRNMNKVTDANPQQSEYAWGTRKLLTFENGRGQ